MAQTVLFSGPGTCLTGSIQSAPYCVGQKRSQSRPGRLSSLSYKHGGKAAPTPMGPTPPRLPSGASRGHSLRSAAGGAVKRWRAGGRVGGRGGGAQAALMEMGEAASSWADATSLLPVERHLLHVKGGGQIRVSVTLDGGIYLLQIEAWVAVDPSAPLQLHWGLCRSDRSEWVVLDQAQLPYATQYAGNGLQAMRTPFTIGAAGQQTAAIDLSAASAPFFVVFDLFQDVPHAREKGGLYTKDTEGQSFSVPVGMRRGSPAPLGVTWQRDGSANFAIYSRSAEGVALCLYDETSPEPTMEIDLLPSVNKTGDVWHVQLDNLSYFHRYGYRCRGELSWDRGNRFHSRSVLLDPYATVLASYVRGQEDLPSPAAALGLLTRGATTFDWEEDYHPDIPAAEIVIYNMNVGAFTEDPSSNLPDSLKGTFLGVAAKVDHLVRLGVNAVLLQPVTAFDASQGPFFPISFFAPDSSLGPGRSGLAACQTFKEMVKVLHSNGIEVLLSMVFSHTAEKNDDAPQLISFRGIDASTYYLSSGNGKLARAEEQGTPNVFNCGHPVVQNLILDSLRHWVVEYHVDGFCFSNGTALLAQAAQGPLKRAALVEEIVFEPLLGGAKIILDTCSPISGVCTTTSFPHWGRWMEVNPLFRDDMRRFVRGEHGRLSGLATRVFGSGDLFASGRGPHCSVNFVSYPIGFTLADLVSYSSDTELSWNSGEEGPSSNPDVNEIRVRQVKNLLMTLMLSQGVPMFTMGDEYGHSKNGNTAQELKGGSFRWDLLQEPYGVEITEFVAGLVGFRQRHDALMQREKFLEPADLTWHGRMAGQPEWDSPDSCFMAATINRLGAGTAANPAATGVPGVGDLYFAFNAHHYAVQVTLPEPPLGMGWHRIADSSLPAPEDFALEGVLISGNAISPFGSYELNAYSSLLMEARSTVY